MYTAHEETAKSAIPRVKAGSKDNLFVRQLRPRLHTNPELSTIPCAPHTTSGHHPQGRTGSNVICMQGGCHVGLFLQMVAPSLSGDARIISMGKMVQPPHNARHTSAVLPFVATIARFSLSQALDLFAVSPRSYRSESIDRLSQRAAEQTNCMANKQDRPNEHF